MRKLFTIVAIVIIAASVYAQTPQKMSYQAVIRNNSDQLIINQNVGMQISILQGSVTGTLVYIEILTPTTNDNGLVSIEIGGGTGFDTITWANGPYFIKTETDPAGGSNYTISGTSQLLSVPFALHSKTAETLIGGITENDPLFIASPANGITTSNISNWNNAYGWGDHATAGYLTSFAETDPIFGAWNKSTGINITASQVSDFQTSVTNNSAVLANTAKNSYPAADATKLAGIEPGAEVNVNPDWNATSGDAQILNKPSIPVGTNPGDIQYWNGTTWVMVPVGQPYQYLKLNSSNVPVWDGILPTVTTTPAFSVTSNYAETGGNVISEGGAPVTERGICWSTTVPEFGTYITAGWGVGSFTTSLFSLTYGQTYYVKAYAKNKIGTSYGDEISFVAALSIGETYQGGKVAYVLQPGDIGYDPGVQHGLIAAPSDQSTGIQWYFDNSLPVGGTLVAIGTGEANTNLIVADQGAVNYAAQLCYNLDLGGYSDWYLPSLNELQKLYENRIAIGGFSEVKYWSSSEVGIGAYSYYFSSGGFSSIENKNASYYVRAIRSF